MPLGYTSEQMEAEREMAECPECGHGDCDLDGNCEACGAEFYPEPYSSDPWS